LGRADNPFASLRDVARERREMEQDERTWVARRAGTLEADQESALAELAQGDDYVAHMLALSEPLDAQATAALDARVAALISEGKSAQVVKLPAQRRLPSLRSVAVVSGLLACAAAALLILNVQRGPELVLPPYQGSLEGSDRPLRGAGDRDARVRKHISPGAQLTLSVQPLEPVAHARSLGARLFLLQGAQAQQVDVPIEISELGAARVSASYQALFGARHGDWELVLFLGEPARLPATPDDARTEAARDASDLRVLHFPVELARD
jgi:hypothetical protein